MRLIDADALSKKSYFYDDYGFRAIAESEIRDAPTVDAVPVAHGMWDDSFDGITPVCSICHMTHNCLNRTPEYCPHCGAKMDGERRGETSDV